MRIALVGPFTGPSLAGVFAFGGEAPLPPGYPGAPLMTALAKALVQRGHQVAAISTDYTTPVAELAPYRRFSAPGLDAYFCPQRPHSFRSSQGRRGRALDFFRFERERLGEAIADFAPELIHAHWTYEFVWAALDSGVPTLATAHDSPAKVLRFMPNPYRLSRYFMARRVLARCQHLTAVSPDLERDLRHLVPAPITVVANSLPQAILQAPGCRADAFESKTLVTVLNGWVDLKNGAKALEAFSLARRADPALRLVCFGADFGPEGPAQRWAAAKGLAEQVDFRGPRPHHEILDQMRASMALLHPSRLEACSMTIAEAMSVGLPVIAGARTGGVAWQLDEGRAGLLVDIMDAPSMADAAIALSLQRARWQTLSDAARVRAKQLFDPDIAMERYLSLYRSLRPGVLPGAAATVRP